MNFNTLFVLLILLTCSYSIKISEKALKNKIKNITNLSNNSQASNV